MAKVLDPKYLIVLDALHTMAEKTAQAENAEEAEFAKARKTGEAVARIIGTAEAPISLDSVQVILSNELGKTPKDIRDMILYLIGEGLLAFVQTGLDLRRNSVITEKS